MSRVKICFLSSFFFSVFFPPFFYTQFAFAQKVQKLTHAKLGSLLVSMYVFVCVCGDAHYALYIYICALVYVFAILLASLPIFFLCSYWPFIILFVFSFDPPKPPMHLMKFFFNVFSPPFLSLYLQVSGAFLFINGFSIYPQERFDTRIGGQGNSLTSW